MLGDGVRVGAVGDDVAWSDSIAFVFGACWGVVACWDAFLREDGAVWVLSGDLVQLVVGGACTDADTRVDGGVWVGIAVLVGGSCWVATELVAGVCVDARAWVGGSVWAAVDAVAGVVSVCAVECT
jgi:hypothetical protein